MEPVDGLIPGFVTALDPFEDAAAFAVAWFLGCCWKALCLFFVILGS